MLYLQLRNGWIELELKDIKIVNAHLSFVNVKSKHSTKKTSKERGRMAQASEKDQHILAKVSILAGSMACTNLSSEQKVPKLMDQYTKGMISLT